MKNRNDSIILVADENATVQITSGIWRLTLSPGLACRIVRSRRKRQNNLTTSGLAITHGVVTCVNIEIFVCFANSDRSVVVVGGRGLYWFRRTSRVIDKTIIDSAWWVCQKYLKHLNAVIWMQSDAYQSIRYKLKKKTKTFALLYLLGVVRD